MTSLRWLGLAAVAYCLMMVTALVPIGSNTNTVDGRLEIDWWTLGSLLVGMVTTGDPIKLNQVIWLVLAGCLTGTGLFGAWLVARQYRPGNRFGHHTNGRRSP